jgi:ribonuclease-3
MDQIHAMQYDCLTAVTAHPGYDLLITRLGHQFRDVSLLTTALTHRSYVNEAAGAGPHNERLEFLGDAVLDLAVAHLLMEACPESSEGELSLVRSRIVNEHSLAGLAEQLGLGQWLFLGRGEENTGGRHKPSILADALEAVLGAIYMDAGFPAALEVCRNLFSLHVQQAVQKGGLDFKSRLQEWVQAQKRPRPRYEVVSEEGPSHDRTFAVAVWLDDQRVAIGRGKSKREAEQQAAELALQIVAGGAAG